MKHTVWSSVADLHIRLLDRALNKVKFDVPDVSLNLERRRAVSFFYFLLTTVGHYWSTSRVSTSPTVKDGLGKTIYFMAVRGGYELTDYVSRRLFNRA